MEPIKQKIIVYSTATDRSYFRDWVGTLNRVLKEIVASRIDRVSEGNFGDCDPYENIFELRIHYGSGHRIYFGRDGRDIVVLLNGSLKGDQKRAAKKAIELWNDYLNRK